ncbi:Alpha-1,4 glucan phosphorylase L-2 isozyme [Morus notabilis]|uniref:Alpha-1,4 glucan phosphorylase n=1 Tax=Morus notabilis TaxID=981085 RepID=W9SRB7_9ROSA|nr:Alpha-1,4 glucan phosphorylase L-2 isozyme [Morus notabilis]
MAATISFSATTTPSKSGFVSGFRHLNRRNSNWRLFFVNSVWTSRRPRRRRNLCVKNVASDKKQEIEDPISQEGTLANFVPDSSSIASSIKYHAEKFELPKAYYATAESVRDMLIINWNATFDYYQKINVKQAYYISMEYLQGRALLNAELDAALGNGGLGRLASCFLDSLAPLNYPAWGYGLRYKYGLFKQLITKDGQEEVAENWLEMGNPWEIVRNDISYPW